MNSADYSEYPARCDERRAFISGFNGSAGTPRVTVADLHICSLTRQFAGYLRMRRGYAERRVSVYRWTLLPAS